MNMNFWVVAIPEGGGFFVFQAGDGRFEPVHESGFDFLLGAAAVQQIEREALIVQGDEAAGGVVLLRVFGDELREEAIAARLGVLANFIVYTAR
jgi:hypothetical protein